MDDLIALTDCAPKDLVWVFGGDKPERLAWHLYQFGLRRAMTWQDAWPPVMPVCRAPSYIPQGHALWHGLWMDAVIQRSGLTAEPTVCHACIVTILERLPHIFTKGGSNP